MAKGSDSSKSATAKPKSAKDIALAAAHAGTDPTAGTPEGVFPSTPPVVLETTKMPITVDITVEKKVAGEVMKVMSDEAQIGTAHIKGQPAIVTRRDRLTKNMGNYESVSIEIGISMPCDPSIVDKAYVDASAWVENRMKTEIEAINSSKKSTTKLLAEGQKDKYKDLF